MFEVNLIFMGAMRGAGEGERGEGGQELTAPDSHGDLFVEFDRFRGIKLWTLHPESRRAVIIPFVNWCQTCRRIFDMRRVQR